MNLRSIKNLVPWRLKLGAKIVLSRLPLGYGVWQRLWLFRHGAMTDPAYAERVFQTHLGLLPPRSNGRPPVLLELGPGDSLLSALLGRRAGVERTWLVDAGPFAVDRPKFYVWAAERLGVQPAGWKTRAEMLEACRAVYLPEGLAALRSIPSGSVDLVWSQAVLEHVRKAELGETARELRRILRPDGIMSHQVDFKDHLGGRLNSLRFAETVWEGDLFSRSGFYTNRLRLSQLEQMFREAGFTAERRHLTKWSQLPTPRARMDAAFASLADDDLLTSDAHLILRPA